ncbi:hypothetical protein D9758_012014 [Tetrapyrgos nigripes]|uniref:MFS general substrate transporter n=1 Tax=Tetrapyrgos nigripes TaxID=182062 RepID=A0A8H5FQX3_9AGAR|nr:hypothetical protein D9758_012014 [Tetrapyrgos nigripes]
MKKRHMTRLGSICTVICSMSSPDVFELATRIPLPQSASTVYLSSSDDLSDVSDVAGRATALPSTNGSVAEEYISDQNRLGGHSTQSGIDDGDSNIPRLNESSLPPMDKGFGAWSYLTAAFLVETIVWGFPATFEYLNDPEYASQPNAQFLLPLIGPIAMGIMYCSSPILNPLLVIRYPHYRPFAMRLGAVICAGSLFGASWAKTIPQLLALQGFAYAVGGGLLYHPTLSYLPAWFFARRGLANGVVFAVRIESNIAVHRSSCGCRTDSKHDLDQTRVPDRAGPRPRSRATPERLRGSSGNYLDRVKGSIKKKLSWWLSHRAFAILLLANTAQAFGYFMPLIWLPTYASSLNLNKTQSSLVLSLLNAGSVVGRLGLGFLSDKLDPWVLAVVVLVSTTLSVFILWGICSFNLAGLLSFGLAYGLFAGGWGTLWTGFIRGNVRDQNETNERHVGPDDPQLASTLFGYLMLSRGIGNIFSTPISSVLQPSSSGSTSASLARVAINNASTLASQKKGPGVRLANVGSVTQSLPHASTGFSVSDHRFQNLILYVGSCFAAAVLVMLMGWGWDKLAKKDRQRQRMGRVRVETS